MNAFLSDTISILDRTPVILGAWFTGLESAWLDANEGPETFSPREVLGHLIHGERADWVARARIILEEGPARPFDPYDRFAQRREMQGKSTAQLLGEFVQLRAGNLRTVREWNLADEQLARRGTHPAFGSVTLRELLATWAVHDLGHMAQIARVMAKRYSDDVGPWKEYLPVLRDRTAGS